jgi:hypothetical protein
VRPRRTVFGVGAGDPPVGRPAASLDGHGEGG